MSVSELHISVSFNRAELLTINHYLSVLPLTKTAEQTWEGMFMANQLYERIHRALALLDEMEAPK